MPEHEPSSSRFWLHAVLVALSVYVITYYASVGRIGNVAMMRTLVDQGEYVWHPTYFGSHESDLLEALFAPLRWADLRIRPRYWIARDQAQLERQMDAVY